MSSSVGPAPPSNNTPLVMPHTNLLRYTILCSGFTPQYPNLYLNRYDFWHIKG